MALIKKELDFRHVTQIELASALGYSDRTVRNMQKEKTFPRNKDGSYSIPDVVKWMIDEAVQAASPDENDRWLAQYRKERALITGMEREQLEKKLIPVDEIEQAFTERAFELSRRLLLMSRRVGQRIAGRAKKVYTEVVEIIDDEVRQAMNDYARPIKIEYDPLKK